MQILCKKWKFTYTVVGPNFASFHFLFLKTTRSFELRPSSPHRYSHSLTHLLPLCLITHHPTKPAMSEVTIELKTAPPDRRFPTTNQTKHCWARYLEFHACAKVKGADDPECEKFKRWYNSMCPIEWVSCIFFPPNPSSFLSVDPS